MASKRTLALVVQNNVGYRYPLDKSLSSGQVLGKPIIAIIIHWIEIEQLGLIFAVIGHNTINIPEIFQVFMAFLV